MRCKRGLRKYKPFNQVVLHHGSTTISLVISSGFVPAPESRWHANLILMASMVKSFKAMPLKSVCVLFSFGSAKVGAIVCTKPARR